MDNNNLPSSEHLIRVLDKQNKKLKGLLRWIKGKTRLRQRKGKRPEGTWKYVRRVINSLKRKARKVPAYRMDYTEESCIRRDLAKGENMVPVAVFIEWVGVVKDILEKSGLKEVLTLDNLQHLMEMHEEGKEPGEVIPWLVEQAVKARQEQGDSGTDNTYTVQMDPEIAKQLKRIADSLENLGSLAGALSSLYIPENKKEG